MQDRLKLLSDEALLELRAQVDAEYKKRRPKMLQIGRFATFDHNGETITMRITGRGSVNYQGVSVDEFGKEVTLPGYRSSKWRCHPNSLTPVLPKIPKTAPSCGSW